MRCGNQRPASASPPIAHLPGPIAELPIVLKYRLAIVRLTAEVNSSVAAASGRIGRRKPCCADHGLNRNR